MLKFFQFIGSVFSSLVIGLLAPYAFYRFSPDMWTSLQIHLGFGWTFGTLFFAGYVIAMLLCWRIAK